MCRFALALAFALASISTIQAVLCREGWYEQFEFRCKEATAPEKQCINYRYECDSIIDCEDFSDEDHCENEHAENCITDFEGKRFGSFQCKDGMCIPEYEQCNGISNCMDQSDEIDCKQFQSDSNQL